MNFYRSLAFKNAIFYLIIFLTGLGIMGYLLLDNSSKRIIQTAENQLLDAGDLIEVQLVEYIDGLVSDMDFLSKSPVLSRYLANELADNYELLSHEFLTLIESNKNFSQIRFLDAETGLEIVRVDQKNGAAEIIPTSQLQVKKDRAYFKNSLSLDPSDIYFSPINLNREFGKVSIPHTPTLRLSRPIYFNDKLNGVIVINTDLANLFEKLANSVGADFNLRMANEAGFYLLHEQKDSTFTFEFDSKIQQVKGDLLTSDNDLISVSDELVSIHRISIPYLKYDIIYHIIANKSALLKPYYEWRNRSILHILIITLIFSILAFILLRSQSKNLKRLTNNMLHFPESRKVSELPTHRNDEIGDLARGFEDMAVIINDQMESIELERHKAEKAEKEKSNFIENISHEIRNPLQSIIGLSTILEQNRPNPNQVEILKSIKLNTSNLNALVNSILDYQNVIVGNVKTQLSWTNINDLILELTTGATYAANQKSIEIKQALDNKLSAFEVNIDRLRISQILSNLISNAITHTPSKGEILVGVALVQKSQDQIKLRFSITDNGVGMTKAELAKIGERYFSKSKEKHLQHNFGLGLTIVHELISLMGAKLEVESEINSGSTFSFEINAASRPKRVEASPKVDSKATLNALKMLIIEDDAQVLEMYKFFFEVADARFVKSFAELTNTAPDTYDIIISDFQLANDTLTDHLDVLQDRATPDTNLILVSGAKPDLSAIEAFFPELIFVQKPVDKEALFSAIELGLIYGKYGSPTLDTIRKDYDYNEIKINKAISLLLEEWKIYNDRLIRGITDNDENELEDILHKFNNTLRRLELPKFEAYLVDLKDRLGDHDIDRAQECVKVNEIMNVYYTFIYNSIN